MAAAVDLAGWAGLSRTDAEEVVLARPLDRREHSALGAEADRLGAHLGLPAVLVAGPDLR